MEMYRQGDLLFVKVDRRPEGKPIHTLAVLPSPITGHTHRIDRGEIYANVPRNGDEFSRASFHVVIPEGGANLLHEEHKTIPLPGGTYAVIRQREVHGYVQD